jgi:hypothetical protein
VPDPSISVIEIAIGKLKRYKSPGADKIPAERIQASGGGGGGKKHCIVRSTDLLSSCETKKNCLTSGRFQLSYLFTKRVANQMQ